MVWHHGTKQLDIIPADPYYNNSLLYVQPHNIFIIFHSSWTPCLMYYSLPTAWHIITRVGIRTVLMITVNRPHPRPLPTPHRTTTHSPPTFEEYIRYHYPNITHHTQHHPPHGHYRRHFIFSPPQPHTVSPPPSTHSQESTTNHYEWRLVLVCIWSNHSYTPTQCYDTHTHWNTQAGTHKYIFYINVSVFQTHMHARVITHSQKQTSRVQGARAQGHM